MDEASKEWKLLNDLDTLPLDSWEVMVRWMAPELCRTNGYLLAEIIIRRGQKEMALDKWSHLDANNRTERIAKMFAFVGVRLEVANPDRLHAEQPKGGAS